MALSTIQNNSFADTAVHGFRNLLINSAMQVAQRSSSVTGVGTTVGYFTVDRWRFADAGSPVAVFTMAQDSDAPDGFSNSLKMTVTTADTSVGANVSQYIDQFIEAQNLQHLAWDTASSGKSLTLSFWVKCSTAQTFAIDFVNEDNARYFNTTYTVNSANVWEYKTISIPADASNGFNNDNGRGLRVRWSLVEGSDYAGSIATAWGNTEVRGGGHENTWVATTSETWQLAGPQLEVSSEPTPFEHRPYADELRRCQRYYYALTDDGTTTNYMIGGVETSTAAGLGGLAFPTSMRAVPTATLLGTNVTKFYSGATGTDDSVSIGANRCSSTIGSLYITGFTGGTVGQACSLYNGGSGSGISFDAEL